LTFIRKDVTKRVIAAISISAPAIRLTKEKIRKLEVPLIETSLEISRKMELWGGQDNGNRDKSKNSQLLIVSDMLGIFEAFTPRFVKKYATWRKTSLDPSREGVERNFGE
jgi:hypothetical protein